MDNIGEITSQWIGFEKGKWCGGGFQRKGEGLGRASYTGKWPFIIRRYETSLGKRIVGI